MATRGWQRGFRYGAQVGLMIFALVGSGCVTHHHRTGHPAPLPTPRHPAPPPVAYPEPHHVDARAAEYIALDVAAQRGYREPQVRDLKWKDDQFRWEAKAEGYVAGKKAKLERWIDGETGEILKLKDHAHQRKHGHGGHYGAYKPPAHPPEGHRQSHAGVELVFDSDLGVYLVVGWHDHFYAEGRFYRFAEDGWQISTELEESWHQVLGPALPPGLAKKHKPGEGHRRGKREHPAKHGY